MKYDGLKIGVGLSGGINSMAVLCWLIENGATPAELHLFYAHFAEHSPDTFQFVADGIRFARKYFADVRVKITSNSILRYFREQKMIPHPKSSPCTQHLKIEPMEKYFFENGVGFDLIGYVRKESRRIRGMKEKGADNLFLTKDFPIRIFDDEWCFEIVDRNIGWHPAIYDLRDDKGKRLFSHNNCLPCKNMHIAQMKHVAQHYPDYMHQAILLSEELKLYWGRDADAYYTEFGREDFEPGQCAICAFD